MGSLTFWQPLKVDDTDANGGGISIIPLKTGRNGTFPVVTQELVSAGIERPRKIFFTADRQVAYLLACCLPSEADDGILICAGTDDDTWGDAKDYEGWKGSGTLHEGVAAGLLSSFIVNAENEGLGFNVNDLVRIAEDDDHDFVRAISVSWSGSVATLTCAPLQELSRAYTTAAIVSACLEYGSLLTGSLWAKEIVPQDIRNYRGNIMQFKFFGA